MLCILPHCHAVTNYIFSDIKNYHGRKVYKGAEVESEVIESGPNVFPKDLLAKTCLWQSHYVLPMTSTSLPKTLPLYEEASQSTMSTRSSTKLQQVNKRS